MAQSFLTGDDVLERLDFNCYLELTKHPSSVNREEILDRLKADALVQRDVCDRWSILNLGAILFAKNLRDFGVSMERKGVRFVSYNGKNRSATVIRRIDDAKGYACGFSSLVDYINDVIPRNEHIGAAFREDRPLFPELAIRELIANALIHQDMTITGAGPSVELFEDRLEITNPGCPLVQVERMIDLPPRSRNAALSSLMRRMRFCEEQGSGLDKVVTQVELFQLPAPNFRAEENSFQAILYGPRSFANMSPDERVRACYQHAVIKHLSGEKMKNESLRERLGIKGGNAAQASQIIQKTIGVKLIKSADADHPRAGYIPICA